MTSTAPWDASLHPRTGSGTFDTKTSSAPELTLDFDITDFLQEPPATPEPFTLLQPVVYTDVNGEDVYGSVTSVDSETGWLTLVEREPGSFGDTGDEEFTVEPRYVRPDDNVSVDACRRQTAGLAAASGAARELTGLSAAEVTGFDNYLQSLRVRDVLKVDGRSDWVARYEASGWAAERVMNDLVHRDLMTREAEIWVNATAHPEGMPELHWDDSPFDDDGVRVAKGVVVAEMLDSYGDWCFDPDGAVGVLREAGEAARDLGTRMSLSVTSTEGIDAEVDAIGLDNAGSAFGAYVQALPVRKATAYRKAVLAAATAMDAVGAEPWFGGGLLDREERTWIRTQGDSTTDEATLVRAAGQAAILRHFQPETGLSDAQLDAISTVFDGAVNTWAKRSAA